MIFNVGSNRTTLLLTYFDVLNVIQDFSVSLSFIGCSVVFFVFVVETFVMAKFLGVVVYISCVA